MSAYLILDQIAELQYITVVFYARVHCTVVNAYIRTHTAQPTPTPPSGHSPSLFRAVSHPLPLLLELTSPLTPHHPVVILHPGWRST